MSNSDEIRWKQRFDNFDLAMKQLDSACLKTSYSELEFAGLIKCFEISFEMLWKTLKDRFNYEGFEVNSPRSAIKQAFELGYISSVDQWNDILESRNVLSHNYDKFHASESETLIKKTYLPMLRDLWVKLKELREHE